MAGFFYLRNLPILPIAWCGGIMNVELLLSDDFAAFTQKINQLNDKINSEKTQIKKLVEEINERKKVIEESKAEAEASYLAIKAKLEGN